MISEKESYLTIADGTVSAIFTILVIRCLRKRNFRIENGVK